MSEEKINQNFRLKDIDEIRNYFIEEINQNELMSKKRKKVCRDLDYIEQLSILVSAIGLKTYVITAGIKRYKSIIKKRKKHNKIVSLAKSKLNIIEVLISVALINSNVSHDEVVLINNVLQELYDMKDEIENSSVKV